MDHEVAQRFLESVGQPADVQFYLRLFRAARRESFAVLVVDARVVRAALESLHFDLRILADLGLTPVVLLGLVDPTDAAEQAERLREWLAEDQVAAEVLPAEPTGDGTLLAGLRRTIEAGVVPLVPLSTAAAGGVDERFAVLGAIAAALETRKVVFVGSRAGLGDPPVSLVSLAQAEDTLPRLSRRQTALLRQIRRLLDVRVSHRMTVSITNPLSLLRELFTLRGAGTLVRRGAIVRRVDDRAALDVAPVRAVIESSFGRPLTADFFEHPFSAVYLADGTTGPLQGAAVLTPSPCGPYLSKFAVERQAQGEGVGTDLWAVLTREHPSFFWRSRPDNPITPWYTKQCQGLHRTADWHVFWRSVEPALIPQVVAWALSAPRDFAE